MTDQAQRLKALNPQQSFIVSAPAGSGKTGLITQRLLGLLCAVENPEEILCITFTKKAAGEMSSRVHSALQKAAYQPRPSDDYEAQTWDLASAALARNIELDWGLLEMPARLRIQTIDSFCRYVASQFALETSLGELPEPMDNPESMYQAAARSMLDFTEEDSETAQQLQLLVAHTGNDLSRCEKLLANMLQKRDQWLPYIFAVKDNRQYFQQVIEQTVHDHLLQLETALAPIAGELIAMADFAAAHLPDNKDSALAQLAGIEQLPESDLHGIAEWKALLSLLITQDKDPSPRKTINKGQGFPADEKDAKARMLELLSWYREQPALHELVVNCCHLPDADTNQSQQALVEALGHLLPLLAGLLNKLFLENSSCDYTAIMLASLQALEQSLEDQVISDITLRLDYQLRHILVDEFQDTSSSQVSLIEHLIAGWQPDDGRTLFLVGDAMQSLYRFRNANVGLFLNAQRYPIGTVQCTPLSLETNFRSQGGIINWVNQAFQRAFPCEADSSRGAIPYSASAAFKQTEPDQAVQFYGFTCKQADQYRDAEARHIASQCQTLAEQQPGQSIAILVRSRNLLKSIVPALRDAELNWQAIEITPLASRMPVVDMLTLTRALISPADRIAWLALLRAPFCGLGLADLLHISNSGDQSRKRPEAILNRLQAIARQAPPDNVSPQGQLILARIAPIIVSAWHDRGRENLRNSVESLWTALGGPATINSSNDLTDVRTYLDLLEKWQVAGRVPDWDGFQQAADKLYAAPLPVTAGSAGVPVIQIMTIFKAKGLEFDHVFLPGLTNSSAQNDKPLLRWHEQVDEHNQVSLMMATLGAHDAEDDSVYRYLKYQETVKSRLENTRILYVAATRAIRRLYLYGKLTPTKTGYQVPAKGTLLAPIWTTIEAGIETGSHAVIALEDSPEQTEVSAKFNPSLRRLPGDFTATNGPGIGMSTGMETITDRTNPANAEGAQSMRARHLGTVLHRSLKQIANEGAEHWPEQRRVRLANGWTAQLKQLGTVASDQDLQRLTRAVEAMLADPDGQWILQQHPEAQSEQPLGYVHSETNSISTSIIDRSFIDQGVRWIIDYKMAEPEAGESKQDFANRQTRQYQAQLTHYAGLYRKMEGNPVKCALYFPLMPMFIEVNVD